MSSTHNSVERQVKNSLITFDRFAKYNVTKFTCYTVSVCNEYHFWGPCASGLLPSKTVVTKRFIWSLVVDVNGCFLTGTSGKSGLLRSSSGDFQDLQEVRVPCEGTWASPSATNHGQLRMVYVDNNIHYTCTSTWASPSATNHGQLGMVYVDNNIHYTCTITYTVPTPIYTWTSFITYWWRTS